MREQATYLPSIHGSNGGQGDTDSAADAFAAAWDALASQSRTRDPRLDKAAQGQADWLALNDFDERNAHLGANGSTANERVRATGYRLPDWWPMQGNQVESATHAWASPEQACADLAAHDTHHDHMLSLGWFADHVVYGVGAAKATVGGGGWFFVAVTAPRES